jgi:hypothetical protein
VRAALQTLYHHPVPTHPCHTLPAMISTLGGFFNLNHFDQSSRANDVIVVRHKDGSLHSTPFNVRFGRAQMWSNAGRVVQVEVNGELTSAVMKIGKGGEAYWLQPTYGAFNHAATSGEGARKAENKPPAQRDTPAVFQAAPRAAEVAPIVAAGNKGSGVCGGGTTVALDGNPTSPSLTVNSGDLRQFLIRPESFADTVAGSPTGGAAQAEAPEATKNATASGHAAVQVGEGSKNAPALSVVPGPPDSSTDLPLLHRGDNGHLVVEPRAIHSAKDVQEARLALQAMAAAEKSRRRLSKLLLQEDAFFLKSAQEEGQLDASATATTDAAEAAGTTTTKKITDPLQSPHTCDANSLQNSVETADVKAARQAATDRAKVQELSPTTPEDAAAIAGDVEVAGPVPVSVPVPAAAAAAASSPSSSRSASSDSYKVEDTDDYFLDPIDADEYVALYGEAELLKNVSFSSSVTSGVSVADGAAGSGSGSDSSKTTPAKLRPAADAVVTPGGLAGSHATSADTTSATSTTVGGLPSPWKEHDSPLSVAKAAGNNSGAPPQPPSVATTASPSQPTKHVTHSAPKREVEEEVMDAEGRPVHPSAATAGGPYFTRTLIPVEADLWKLHLRDGCNTVRYLVRKDKGEVVSIACNIFLWNWTDRLVVSDVDGTITKSDLLGHFYAMLGKGGDWTHPGICTLYSKISRNGYHMVYLTARSVSQINQTKTYLFTLQQDGVGLPLGPVLTAPQRFFTALTREVSKQSHLFKIACLTSVRAAFPPHTKPFFAGFGNRYNDVISYDAVGIPTHKIFIIDPSSVLHVCLVKQTYRDLGHLVDVTFPPLKKRMQQLARAPRRPHLSATTPGIGEGDGDGGARSTAMRHAYARDLLHRSSSASSSFMSSSCSDVSASNYSSDTQGHGSASLDYAGGDLTDVSTASVSQSPPAAATATCPATADAPPAAAQDTRTPHSHNEAPYHHHSSITEGEEDQGGLSVRHTSVAFSLANSFGVSANNGGSGSGSGGVRGGSDGASASPPHVPQHTLQAGVGGQMAPLADLSPHHAFTVAGAAPTGTGGELSPPGEDPNVKPESESTECSGFSGPASPFMAKTAGSAPSLWNGGATTSAAAPPPSAAVAGVACEVRGGAGETVPGGSPLPSTHSAAAPATSAYSVVGVGLSAAGHASPQPPQHHVSVSPNAVQRSNAVSSNHASLSAAPCGGGRGATSASNGPKYNYGQRGSSRAGDAVDSEEEEVPVDAEFSSFAYWRMDPKDLIAPTAKVAPKSSATAVEKKAVADAARGAAEQTEARGAARQPTSHTPLPSLNTRIATADASAGESLSDARRRVSVNAGSPLLGNTTTAAVAAVEAVEVNTGGTLDAHSAAAGGAATQASVASANTNAASPAAAARDFCISKEAPGGAAALVSKEDKQAQSAAPNAEGSSGAKLATLAAPAPAAKESKPSSLSLSPSNAAAAVAPQNNEPGNTDSNSNAAAAVNSKSTTNTRRGFFSNFGFGRGQTTQTAPESPDSIKARQAQEEAKKKALAHPDAWEYYHLQQQQQQQQQQPASTGLNPSSR